MALNVNRWLQYAKARIDSAVGSGHDELDRLEAEQEAQRADKPWLASDSTAPTFDEARARIEWEADQQAKASRRRDAAQDGSTGSATDRARTDRTRDKADDSDGSATGRRRGGSSGSPDTADDATSRGHAHGPKTDDGPNAAVEGTGLPTSPTPTGRATTDADSDNVDPTTTGASTGTTAKDHVSPSPDQSVDPGPAPRSPQQVADDAELETARLELEDRQRQSIERLAQIRQELGIDDPAP